MRIEIVSLILVKTTVALLFVFLTILCAVTSTQGQTRRATTINGTIGEMLSLLEKKEDKRLLRNFVVKFTERLSSSEIDETLKSFRSPTGDKERCAGISKAEQLEKALLAAEHLTPKILTKPELEKYNYNEVEQKLTWGLIRFETPPCPRGRIVMYFVKVGRFWYLKN